jgi:uncharacterized protein (TIRG00374 family)
MIAFGIDVPWSAIVLVWVAGAGVSTLNLTPGGSGVVEAALTVAMVAGGVPISLAATSVLLYRFVSLWMVLVVGSVVLFRTRADIRPQPAAPTGE